MKRIVRSFLYKIGIKPKESPMERIHGMLHEIAYLLSTNNIDAAKRLVAKADMYAHDHC
jgi:hypothetical protein